MALHGRFCAQIGHFHDGPMWVNGKTGDRLEKISPLRDARATRAPPLQTAPRPSLIRLPQARPPSPPPVIVGYQIGISFIIR